MNVPMAIATGGSVDREIGAGLRRIRRQRKLSLEDVSGRTGLSIGFLSQVERGLSSPTLRVLTSLGDALGVALADLFVSVEQNPDNAAAVVVRQSRRSELQLWRSGIRKQLLTPLQDGTQLNLYLVEMEPGASTGDEPYSHTGEEAGLVIQGAMELVVDAQSWTLQEGDSFRFPSSSLHRFSNRHHDVTKVVWVNSVVRSGST